MSELISGKEALIALANGENVEFNIDGVWVEIEEGLSWLYILNDCYKFRLKPSTIEVNGVEIPAPFEPKDGDGYWYLHSHSRFGYAMDVDYKHGDILSQFGAWRTEEEIKIVVEQLRKLRG